MCYLINAWLERRDPYLEIVDKQRGEVLLHLQSQALRALIDSGVVDCAELTMADGDSVKQLIRDILLYSCDSFSLAQIAQEPADVAISGV